MLRLLATDLDGPEIARHLFVSPNTMRTHTRNIYAKLGVNSRRAAVRRAVRPRPLAKRRSLTFLLRAGLRLAFAAQASVPRALAPTPPHASNYSQSESPTLVTTADRSGGHCPLIHQ